MGKGNGKGKRKIEMTKIKNDNELYVAFSKRRIGLFKCADTLNKLTGAHVAVLVFSPTGKVYPFGCPDVEPVVATYKSQTPQNFTEEEKVLEARRHADLEKLQADLEVMQQQLEIEKKHGEWLDQMNQAEGSVPNWWEGNVNNMSLDQLETLKRAMMDLQERILNDHAEMLNQEIHSKPND